MELFGNTNALEGLRIVLAFALLAACGWGLMRAEDGQYAFAAPVRAREISERRVILAAHATVGALLGLQSVVVAGMPDAYPLSAASASGSVTLILSLAALFWLTVHRIGCWASLEETIGRRPFTPTTDERLTEAARIGRPMIHRLNTDLAIVAGVVDTLAVRGPLTQDQVGDLEMAADSMSLAIDQIQRLQALVRGLDPAYLEQIGAPIP